MIKTKKSIDKLEQSIQKLNKQIINLEQEKSRLIATNTKLCPHNILDCRQINMRYGTFGTSPPFIICLKCGLAEEGWGCGYRVFRNIQYNDDLAIINRDTANKYIRTWLPQ